MAWQPTVDSSPRLPCLDSTLLPYLDGDRGHDGLGVDEAGLAEVVEPPLLEDLSTGLEPDGLGGAGLVELGDDAAQGAEQGPPGQKRGICENGP